MVRSFRSVLSSPVRTPAALFDRFKRLRRRYKYGLAGLAAIALVGGAYLAGGSLSTAYFRALPVVSRIVASAPPRYASSIVGVKAPLSVAVTPDGSVVYVAEGSGERFVAKINVADGASLAMLAPPRTAPGTRKPVSVAVDPNGMVYVVDRLRGDVDIYDVGDRWLGVLPHPRSDGPWEPLTVDVDDAGNVYVTNTAQGGPLVTQYSGTGQIVNLYSPVVAENVPVEYAGGVAVDNQDRPIISDSNNGRLVALEPGSNAVRTAGNSPDTIQLGIPRRVVVDSNGNLLVVDAVDHTITGWQFDETSVALLFTVGEGGIQDGSFLYPNALAVDSEGDIFVADRDNDRIQVWRY